MKKLLLATILAVTQIAAMANNVTTIAVVTGECAKVMVMDIDSEPSLCSDKVTDADSATVGLDSHSPCTTEATPPSPFHFSAMA